MIRIEALPARDGDCLWVEWEHEGRTRRMLVDGGRGRAAARRIEALSIDDRHVDLVVCTHIDADHIEGILDLFAQPPAGFTAGEVWFNGQRHLRDDVTGPRQGSRLELILGRAGVPWNARFGNGAVAVAEDGPLPVKQLPGLTVTLLAPGPAELSSLDRAWPDVLAELDDPLQGRRGPDPDAGVDLAALVDRLSTPDESAANGSSIAFLAEHADGGRVLFTADAPAAPLLAGLRRLAPDGAPVPVALCKVPHHGSHHNVSTALVAALDCPNWLLSTSGAGHGHPDRRAIARIVAGSPGATLWFNYASGTTAEYAEPGAHGYHAVHPAPGHEGIALEVENGRVTEVPL
ncbi:MBL fold metallo-hydrolase [Actinoplanes awajinensis]|uniref:Metallo-beta-lactamase domain-containing protein n=1 Tax=Actinoplanes awajinensis subsp. mycoplanecinus TaxID=135947 RepID=A0A101J7N4_9ACTN|nr:MBL fold metallo-hydrolase [Actinoplanes awajinensis]KUL21591.1 hypothetical protein ADL15_50375 [Actinoplanes awajinensis subsp. mycoplanecinus]